MLKARYSRIVLFFSQVVITVIVWDLILPKIGLRRWSQSTRSKRYTQIAKHFRELAIRLGGVMIKVGQFLSARVDVLPAEITAELSGLQDEVPPEDFGDIRQVIESEFGIPLEEKFADFEINPVAAASLGQVHQARVDAQNVVVKVQRPDIDKVIATDMAALRTVGNWLQRYRPIRRRADVPALIDEFNRILLSEIDYLAEGGNAETFAENFKDQPGVRVPTVFWSHTTRRVLTLEDVRAIKITDYAAITAAQIDRAEVAKRLFQTYLRQIFEDSFFHADPHPGNLFVSPVSEEKDAEALSGSRDWQLTFVDFGMVGHVPQKLRAGMREMVIAIGMRDAERLIQGLQLTGVLLPEADLSLLEKAEAKAFERFGGMSMSELQNITTQEVHEFAGEFRELIYSMPFQIPEDLILLGRTIGILSGLCTGIYPDFNAWEEIAPFAQKLIAEEVVANRQTWLAEVGKLVRILLSFPKRMDVLLARVERGELVVQAPQVASQVSRLQRSVDRLTAGLIFAGLTIGGIQLLLAGREIFGTLLLAGAGVTIGWVVLSSLRRR